MPAEQRSGVSAYDPFALGTIVRAVPTTESQRELWLSVRLGGDSANCAFNESVRVDLLGPLNVGALERAFAVVVERHEALRAVLTPDGQAMCILEGPPASLPFLDLAAESEVTRGQRVDDLLAREVRTPFDLEQGPLFRAQLVRLEAERHLLVLTAHHIVFDGWSAAVFLNELGAVYSAERAGQPASLPAAPSFADYAVAERSAEYQAAERTAEAYWLGKHEGDVSQTEFPTEQRRPDLRTYDARRLDWEVDPTLLAELRTLGSRNGATFVATLFAAFGAFVARLTGKSEVVLGMPAAGQAATGEHGLVGHCVNTLPVRCRFDLDQPFAQCLGTVRSTLLEAQEHRELGFGSLVQRLRIARDPSRSPLVSILFNIDVAITVDNFQGLETRLAANPRAFENFEISLNAVDYGNRLVLETTYNTNALTAEEMERRLEGFSAMLADLIARPDQPLARLDVLAPSERERIREFALPVAGEVNLPPVHRLISEQAEKRPEAIAVAANDGSLSYAELTARARRLARLLVQSGVTPGSRVAVCLSRRADMLVALLGILEAGAAYVPVDPAYPKRRIEMILEDAAPQVVLAERSTEASLPARITGSKVDLDEALARLDAFDSSSLDLSCGADALAYVIFTSGSTGRPKGVQIPHSALSNFLTSMAEAPGLSPGQRLLAVTTISFDIAGLELFLPLISGATVRLLPQDAAVDAFTLKRVLETEQVDLFQATPATFRMLLDAGWRGSRNLKLLCGGEPFPVDLARALLPCCGELYNMYGPTETTVWSTLQRVESADGPSIPIGRPIARTQVYVLDGQMQQVPIGVEGDLYIGGAGLALGYHGRPDLTGAAFLPDPFTPGARIYRTGDRARWLSDGTLDHRGRSDSQVKLRGFRIELGEIETALAETPGVREVAVLVREDTPGDKRLVAYLTYEGEAELDAARLRERLEARLPRYMVPSAFVLLETMPLTPARKIDRRALPAPTAATRTAEEAELPEDEDERALVTMFRELLQQGDLGRGSDFFESGGHSLLAVRLFARIERELGVKLPLSTILVAPTAAKLAALVRGDAPSEAHSSVRLLRRGANGERPLFLVHDADGETLLYVQLARGLRSAVPVYGISPAGDRANPLRHTRVEEIASEYVKRVRAVQPQGPYALGGLCAGGVLAFAMALEFEQRGDQVEFVALLDSAAPGAEVRGGLIARRRFERFLASLSGRGSPNAGPDDAGADAKRTMAGAQEKLVDAARRLGRFVRYEADRASTKALNQLKFWNLRNPIFDDTEIGTFSRGLTVRSIYEIAERNYEPRARLRAPALLIRATDGVDADEPSVAFYEDPDLGWSEYCLALDVIDSTGGHSSMLQEPHVREVAASLSARLALRPHLAK